LTKFRTQVGLPALKPSAITGSDFLVKALILLCYWFCPISSTIISIHFLLIKPGSQAHFFYKQTIGHGQPFKVWKFRTMVVNAEQLQKIWKREMK